MELPCVIYNLLGREARNVVQSRNHSWENRYELLPIAVGILLTELHVRDCHAKVIVIVTLAGKQIYCIARRLLELLSPAARTANRRSMHCEHTPQWRSVWVHS
jgi:hypothetical protein